MKLTALLKKIGEILNPFRAAIPEDTDTEGKESGVKSPDDTIRTRSQRKKDFLPEADLTTNIDRYRHPSEF